MSAESAAHLLHLHDLLLEVLEVEAFAGLDLLRELFGFLAIDALLHVLDQREHVAHAEDARGHAVGMERLEAGQLLADARELDRLARDVTHRQRRAAARIAVELGQHDAGERQRFGECARGVDRVLALHRVDDEQRLDRLHRVVQLADLAHHRLVDREPSRGVDDEHVVVMPARVIERARRDVDRLLADRRRKEIGVDLPRERLAAARSRQAGRRRSSRAALSSCAPPCSHFASLPLVVVLPLPCRPAISTTAGGASRDRARRCARP